MKQNNTNQEETRLFYVVESDESAPEIFLVRKDALKNAFKWYCEGDTYVQVSIKEVNNAYIEEGVWNYEERNDTFDTIKIIAKYP